MMGRRRMTQAQLAREIGKTEMWMSLRLRGKQPIDMNDLALIARALDVGVHELLPAPEIAALAKTGLSPSSDGFTLSGNVIDSRPLPHSPFDRGPREHTRPTSAEKGSRRRPQPMRPGNRPMAA